MTAGRAGFIALPGAEAAAGELAGLCGSPPPLGMESRRFPDGERYLRVLGEPAEAMVIVAHLAPPDEQALALVFLADALRELGARRVIAVIPYLPYMRQDARFKPGEAVTSPSFARLIGSRLDGLVTVDPHLHRTPSLEAIYPMPAVAVASAPAIAQWVAAHVPQPLIVGPDDESSQWVAEVASRLKAPSLVLRKRRLGDREVEIEAPDPEKLQDRTPVLLDDVISSGRTLAEAVRLLRAAGSARPPVCIAVHGLFAGDALEVLRRAGAGQVLTCNTVPGQTALIDVMPSVAQALREMLGRPGQRAAG